MQVCVWGGDRQGRGGGWGGGVRGHASGCNADDVRVHKRCDGWIECRGRDAAGVTRVVAGSRRGRRGAPEVSGSQAFSCAKGQFRLQQ